MMESGIAKIARPRRDISTPADSWAVWVCIRLDIYVLVGTALALKDWLEREGRSVIE
jgi:hypothetical protein